MPDVRSAVRDTVQLTVAQGTARAGAVVTRVASEVIGTLVDLFA